jgi:hydroxymethylpyrimidine/phosphomethylpyrimidine kinase
MKPPPCVLTIAGSDSGGGAGVQADARTIHAVGCYALTAITAITAQNTRGVRLWRAVAPQLLQDQLEAVLDDFPVAAIKTGLLPNAAAVRLIARTLARSPRKPLVVDPVIASTSGTRFLSSLGIAVLKRELLPLATLVTPNWPEIGALTGVDVHTFADAETAGRQLAAECDCAVLVKGGHAPGAECSDCLIDRSGSIRWFRSTRMVTRNTHGTGCVLSAAIAAQLARGASLETAVAKARAFLVSRLRAGQKLRWNGKGAAFAL